MVRPLLPSHDAALLEVVGEARAAPGDGGPEREGERGGGDQAAVVEPLEVHDGRGGNPPPR